MTSFGNILDFCILIASMRHADRTIKIHTPLEVGLVIRGRRRELNLTQGELAYKIGIGRQWISAVERRNPVPDRVLSSAPSGPWV